MSQSDCFTEMFSHLHTYMKKGMFVDVYFIIEGSAIGAHKAVLASSSDVFRAMFESEMKESETQEVVISDVDEEVFRAFLDYVYSRNDEHVKNHVEKLFMLADKYDIQPLLVSCETYILQSLNEDNVVDYYQLSDLYRRDELKQSLIDFIKENLNNVIKTDEWLDLKSKNPQLVSAVIQNLIAEERIRQSKRVESYDEIDRRFCDAFIKLGEVKIPVHKFVLIRKSAKFKKIFQANPRGFEVKVDVKAPDVKKLMDYVYVNKLPDVGEIIDVHNFIRLSQIFQLDNITNHCVLEMEKKMSLKTAIWAAILGHDLQLESLTTTAMEFIVKHLDELYDSKDWKSLLNYPDLLTEIHLKTISRTILKNENTC